MWSSKQLTLVFACLAGLIGGSVAAPAAVAAPNVTISPGVVVGKPTTVSSAPSATATVFNYLGVPFAAVPTGTLRFAPPVTPTAWTRPLMATAFPPACRQEWTGGPRISENLKKVFDNPGGPRLNESEDCLYLNVFAPTNASSTNRKAVLFWIFGGNLQEGTGSFNIYNGSSFAGFQDVVVVTINYRTNIFGFSGSPELPAAQRNAGYLDQRLALKWVQDNIAAFGGDPNRVTIFGESAGAYSVKQLLAHPPQPRPFIGAILESQQLAATNLNQGVSYAQTVARFGCSAARSQLDCLRRVDGVALEQYVNDNSLSFPPFEDNVTQSFDIRSSITSRRFAQVPIFLGTNSEETRVFIEAGVYNLTNTSLDDALSNIFNGNNTLVNLIIDAYGGQGRSVTDVVQRVLTDFLFTCTTSRIANLAVANGYAAWRYYYNATFANLQYLPNIGAYHGSEIALAFGTYPIRNSLGAATPAEIALSAYMQRTWANFAKNPAAGPSWPVLTTNYPGNQLGELGGRNPNGETTINANIPDFFCPLYDPYYLVNGL